MHGLLVTMSAFLTAEWRYLIMANYAVDPAILQPRLPAYTELDVFNGIHYVSLVGFLFDNTRLKGIPIPFHQRFEEVNLRFYVRRYENKTWKRGVVFIKEIVPKWAISWVAKQFYGEPYQTLPMSHEWQLDTNILNIRYNWQWHEQTHSIAVQAHNTPLPLVAGSEAEFITEHYWGYTKLTDHITSEYEVQHPRWNTFSIENFNIQCDFGQLYGNAFAFLNKAQPVSVLLADGSKISVLHGRKLSSTKDTRD